MIWYAIIWHKLPPLESLSYYRSPCTFPTRSSNFWIINALTLSHTVLNAAACRGEVNAYSNERSTWVCGREEEEVEEEEGEVEERGVKVQTLTRCRNIAASFAVAYMVQNWASVLSARWYCYCLEARQEREILTLTEVGWTISTLLT